MRYKEIISESVDTEYYMREACGIFAYALWLAYNKPENGRIGIMSYRHGTKWSKSIPFEVTHVFFLIEGNSEGIDVKGIRPIWQIGKDAGTNIYFQGQYHPDDFLKKFMGNSDKKPLYGGQKEIKEALSVIKQSPNTYIKKLFESVEYVTFNNQYMRRPITTKIWTNPDPKELDEYIQTKPDKKIHFRYVIDNDDNIHFGDGYYVTHEMMDYEFPHEWKNTGALYFDKQNRYQIVGRSNFAYNKCKELMNKSNKKEYDFFNKK